MDFKTFYFSFDGRIGRQDFWLRYVLPYLGMLFVTVLFTSINENAGSTLSLIFSLIAIWPSLAVIAKRWHDRNKSGWWILINIIPIVGSIWALVENGFLRGTVGPNHFGPDPLLADAASAPAE